MRARKMWLASGCLVWLLLMLLGGATTASAQSARTRYESALSREPEVRKLIEGTGPEAPSPARVSVQRRAKRLAATYDALVRRYPTSGYSDNALAQAGSLHQALYERYGRDEDKQSALDYYRRLISSYPHSSLLKKTRATVATLTTTRVARAPAASAPAASRSTRKPAEAAAVEPTPAPVEDPPVAEREEPPVADRVETPAPDVPVTPVSSPPPPPTMRRPAPSTPASLGRATLTDVSRTVLPEAVRVTLTFDREVTYREERIAGPARVFFDLPGVSSAPTLQDAVLDYANDVVKQIRLGRHPDKTVRVVLDLEGVTKHSVFTLYNPFRIVIDCERSTAMRAASAAPARLPVVPPPTPVPPPPPAPVVRAEVSEEAPLKLAKETDLPAATPTVEEASNAPITPVPARETAPTPSVPPAPPSTNSAGGFSIARQLGLGVSRIVIDPGHGGRDPGVQGRGMSEAPLTLDVALRLEKLLLKEPGIEVVLTRRSDVYVPLEERTEIANREGADLFLSIHANASRNPDASGIETYYLSFASSPEAEAVAARENSASGSAMHNLPDIIKAIALNNKLDESRDFAAMVQEAMLVRARRTNRDARDRGVKKAPFVVLIGAEMPSVLAEISFLSHRQENQLLRSAAYKDRIAEALHAAVMRYRRSLKGQGKVADQ
jgi:N-acetylmuramoyl-L-alanine amidase